MKLLERREPFCLSLNIDVAVYLCVHRPNVAKRLEWCARTESRSEPVPTNVA
jgi:hypothetical protein